VKLPVGPHDALRLAEMEPEELRAWLAKCTPRDLLLLDAQFEMWAQTGQLPPRGEGWRVWLMMAGRGFGKTRAGAEWVHGLALTGR
jgi:phage terminase large subunit-like protein